MLGFSPPPSPKTALLFRRSDLNAPPIELVDREGVMEEVGEVGTDDPIVEGRELCVLDEDESVGEESEEVRDGFVKNDGASKDFGVVGLDVGDKGDAGDRKV